MTIGERIRVVRGHLDVAEFAAKIGISAITLGKIERDTLSPDAETVRIICYEFGISVEWLCFGQGPMSAEHSGAAQLEVLRQENQELKNRLTEMEKICAALQERVRVLDVQGKLKPGTKKLQEEPETTYKHTAD